MLNKISITAKRSIIFTMIASLLLLGFGTVDSKAMSKSQINSMVIKKLYAGKAGRMTCDFDGYQNTRGRHEGVDYKLYEGATVYAISSGKVTRVTNTSSNSKLSTLAIYDSANNKTVVYLHMKNIAVTTGESVQQGQKIAREGNRAGGSAHTHIEVRDGKKTSAAKSVNDYTLENKSPYSYFEKVLGGSSNPGSLDLNHKSYLTWNRHVPMTTYTRATSADVKTYSDRSLKNYSGKIFAGDKCTITEYYSDTNSCRVKYPVKGGTKTAYASLYDFFPYCTLVPVKLKSNTSVYAKSNLQTKIGTSYTSDSVYISGTTIAGMSSVKIVYNVSGGYKAGYISTSQIK